MDILAIGAQQSVSEALNKGMCGDEDLSETQLRQFQQYCRGIFWAWEDAFYHHDDGLYSETAFDRLKLNVTGLVSNVGVRGQWRLQRHTFAAAFVAWVEELISETRIDEATDSLDLWRTALKEVRAGTSPRIEGSL